jgi:hypothetical protein
MMRYLRVAIAWLRSRYISSKELEIARATGATSDIIEKANGKYERLALTCKAYRAAKFRRLAGRLALAPFKEEAFLDPDCPACWTWPAGEADASDVDSSGKLCAEHRGSAVLSDARNSLNKIN